VNTANGNKVNNYIYSRKV